MNASISYLLTRVAGCTLTVLITMILAGGSALFTQEPGECNVSIGLSEEVAGLVDFSGAVGELDVGVSGSVEVQESCNPLSVNSTVAWITLANIGPDPEIPSGLVLRADVQVAPNESPLTRTGLIEAVASTGATGAAEIFQWFNPNVEPVLTLRPEMLSFSFSREGGAARQTLAASNEGTGSMPFQVFSPTQSGGTWLSVSPNSGELGQGEQVGSERNGGPHRLRGPLVNSAVKSSECCLSPVGWLSSKANLAVDFPRKG